MSEKKNIDQLFKDRLEHFEVAPPEMAWENIEARLLAKKKKRRAVPFWWKLSGVAAVFVLGFLIGPYFNGGPQGNPTQNNPVVQKENNNANPAEKAADATTTTAISPESPSGVAGVENPNETHNTVSKPANNQAKEKIDAVVNSSVSNKDRQNQVAVSQTNKAKKHNIKKDNASFNTTKQAVASGNDKDADQQQKSGGNESVAFNRDHNKTTNQKQNTTVDKTAAFQKQNQNPVVNQDAPVKNNQSTDSKESTLTDIDPSKNKNTTAVATAEKPEEIKKKDSTNLAVVEPNALEELLKEKEKEEKIAKERKENRWQVTPNIAPIYFSSMSNGSPLDEKLAANEKVYGTNYSYGLGVNYAVNKKLNIRSGLNTFATDYDTKSIVFYQNTNASRMQNVTPTLQGSLIQIDPLSNVNASFGRLVQEKFEGTLNQRMGYIEMPVEVSYKLLSRKFGIDLIGGVSTLFLTQNDVYLRTSGLNMKIGEANNLNDIHFSTNIGLGLKYNFLKRFDARVEPLFKYQINTYSSGAGGFKPYIFGIYSGISYHF